jgi:hypothetical protein
MLENVPDIVQSTHGIRNNFADIRNVPTNVPCECFDSRQSSIETVQQASITAIILQAAIIEATIHHQQPAAAAAATPQI